MKWAKTIEQLIAMKPDPGIKSRCFEVYDTITDDIADDKGKEKKIKKGEKNASALDIYEEWVTYPLTKTSDLYPKEMFPDFYEPLPNLDKEARERYEIFCGGFLFYSDVAFKEYYTEKMMKKNGGNVFEHKIFFEWFDENNKKLDVNSTAVAKKVTIWITETPEHLNATPKDPPGSPPPY